MKVLLIGSEGYVGSYLLEHLRSKNLDVVGWTINYLNESNS